MKQLLNSLILITSINYTLPACSVAPITFCETATILPDDIIVSGKIISIDDDGLDFEVIEVIRGFESKSIIRIWDGTDFDCNGLFSMAASDLGNIGDSLVLILPLIDSLENTWDQLDDYRRPNYFGPTTSLQYKDDKVFGYLTYNPVDENSYSTEYHTMKQAINSDECGNIILNDIDITLDKLQFTFNNPVIDYININHKNQSSIEKVNNIYDTNGQLIFSMSTIKPGYSIPLSQLPKGIYILNIVEHKASRSYKFFKT